MADELIELTGDPAGESKKSNLLKYIGAFVLSYLVVNAAMYFYLKRGYEERMAEAAMAIDSAKVAQVDTVLAEIDTTVIDIAAIDTTAIDSAAIAMIDSLDLAQQLTRTAPETLEAVIDTSLVAMEGVPTQEDSLEQEALRKRVSQLTRILEKMRPDESAKILSKMDDKMVVQVLMRMRDRNAAKVMGQLPVSRAVRLSKLITDSPSI